jgi:hypothetical protein
MEKKGKCGLSADLNLDGAETINFKNYWCDYKEKYKN